MKYFMYLITSDKCVDHEYALSTQQEKKKETFVVLCVG